MTHPARLGARRPVLAALCACVAALAMAGTAARAASAADYVANEVIVAYAPATPPASRMATARSAGAAAPQVLASHTRLLRLKAGVSVPQALTRLRRQADVRWAVPDYIAHASGAGGFVPNDPGTAHVAGGWTQLQWNFVGAFGVNAPQAWVNVGRVGAFGGRGVTVAVLDTGIAYKNVGRFRRSPDFLPSQFVRGYDFVGHNNQPVDHNGHGTHVAGTIAEATNNGYGLTGLAYGAKLMPVRVLDTQGEGEASVIARGVRFAAVHGARVINLSLEFSSDVTASDIPELLDALRFAHRRGVVIVGAAGNEGHAAIAYPARAPNVISVGATTEHGCLANFSNDGPNLTIVAPGGGPDGDLGNDPQCSPNGAPGRDVYQITFMGSPRHFFVPPGFDGTSMASPHVAATAALVIASRVLGPHPSPDAVTARLRATARHLGGPTDHSLYGAGLVDAAAATAPGGPGAVASSAR